MDPYTAASAHAASPLMASPATGGFSPAAVRPSASASPALPSPDAMEVDEASAAPAPTGAPHQASGAAPGSRPASASSMSFARPSAPASASPNPEGGASFFVPQNHAQAAPQPGPSQNGSPALPVSQHMPAQAGTVPSSTSRPGSAAPGPSATMAGPPRSTSPALSQQGATSALAKYGSVERESGEAGFDQISAAIKEAPPSTLRHAIRDHWEKCMLGSDYHMIFLLNAALHQAAPEVLQRTVRDFGERMVKISMSTIARQFDTQDLDDIADTILPKASGSFLDKALARRLETIDGRQLIDALARAERLGYDAGDIVEQNGVVGREHVVPSMNHAGHPAAPPAQAPRAPQASQAPPQGHLPHVTSLSHQGAATKSMYRMPQAPQAPQAAGQSQNQDQGQGEQGIVFCPMCNRPCSSRHALRYHTYKAVCNKPVSHMTLGKDVCPHCGSRFGGRAGLMYHLKSQVCGPHSQEDYDRITAMLGSGSWAGQPHAQPQAPINTPPSATQTAPTQSTPTSKDQYAALTPAQRQAFEEDMRKGEEHYGHLMREAGKLPEPQRSRELSRLKNSYNTKQSTTRKKYGMRLRQKRTKQEMAAERTRLFGNSDGPSLWDTDKLAKKAGTDGPGSASSTPQPGNSQVDTPRKRVPVGEMGGLGASSATAELTDPTALVSPSRPRFSNQTPSQAQPGQAPPQGHALGTSDDPMAIDSKSDSTDSDPGDEDIPAQ